MNTRHIHILGVFAVLIICWSLMLLISIFASDDKPKRCSYEHSNELASALATEKHDTFCVPSPNVWDEFCSSWLFLERYWKLKKIIYIYVCQLDWRLAEIVQWHIDRNANQHVRVSVFKHHSLKCRTLFSHHQKFYVFGPFEWVLKIVWPASNG